MTMNKKMASKIFSFILNSPQSPAAYDFFVPVLEFNQDAVPVALGQDSAFSSEELQPLYIIPPAISVPYQARAHIVKWEPENFEELLPLFPERVQLFLYTLNLVVHLNNPFLKKLFY